MQGKELMKSLHNTTGYNGRYFISNANIRKIKCDVAFVPKLDSENQVMKYDVTYKVVGGEYGFEYDNIVYNIDGKTRQKSIPTRILTVELDEISYSKPGSDAKDISKLIERNTADGTFNELLRKNIEDLFTDQLGTIMKKANDALENDTSEIVDISIQKNKGCPKPDLIWELGKDIPEE